MRLPYSQSLLLFALLGLTTSATHSAAQSNFGSVKIGASATGTVTVTFPGSATLKTIAFLTQGAANLDFTQAAGGSCAAGAAYAKAASCTVEVKFAPKFPGARSGAVVLSSASGPVATALLLGTGLGPQSVLFSNLVPPSLPAAANTSAPPIFGIALDRNGNAYMANPSQNSVGVYPLSNGSYGSYFSSTVGTGLSAPSGVAVDAAGNVDIADTGNGRVVQEVLAGGAYVQTVIASGLKAPVALAIDPKGNVYVADQQAGIVYEEHPSNGAFTQSTVLTGLNSPTGLAVDASDTLYIADAGTTLLKETLASGKYQQSTIAGNFFNLVAVAVDPAGNLYLTTSTPTGAMFQDFTVGALYIEALSDGAYTLRQLSYSSEIGNSGFSASGIALDPSGNVTLVDETTEYPSGYYVVLDYLPATPAQYSFANTIYHVPSSDSPRTYALVNFGNEPLTIGAVTYPADFPEKPGVAGDCSSNSSLASGAFCTLTVQFDPDSILSDCPDGVCQQSVTIDSNSLNAPGTLQSIAFQGGQRAPVPTVTIASSGSPTTSVFPITYTVQVTGVSGFPAPTGQVGISDNVGDNYVGAIDSNGRYSFSVQSLPIGVYTFQAIYEGDTYYGNGSGAGYTQLVIGRSATTSNSPVSLGTIEFPGSKTNEAKFVFTGPETLKSIQVLTQGVPNLDFTNSGAGTCVVGKTYAAKSSCTVGVLFTPSQPGMATGAVVLTDSNGNRIGTAYLKGFATAPFLAFDPQYPSNIYATQTFAGTNGMVADGAGNLDYFYNYGFDQLTPSKGAYTTSTLLKVGAGAVPSSGTPAMDGAGNLYVAGGGAVLGIPSGSGYQWTSFSNCCLHANAIAVDADGAVYIVDQGGSSAGDNPIIFPPAIYKETPSNGAYIQTVLPVSFASYPISLAVDPAGNLLLSDSGNYNYNNQTGSGILYRYAPQANGAYTQTLVDQGNWYIPASIVFDRVGNLYVADNQPHYGTDGDEGPLYGYWYLYEEARQTNGAFARQLLSQDTDSIAPLAAGPNQSLFLDHQSDGVSSNDWNSIMLWSRSPNATLSFGPTTLGSTTATETVTLQNSGNAAAAITSIAYPADFPHAAGVKTDCAAGHVLQPGSSCTLSIQFTPVASLGGKSAAQLNEVVTVKTTGPGAFTDTNLVEVSGQELKP